LFAFRFVEVSPGLGLNHPHPSILALLELRRQSIHSLFSQGFGVGLGMLCTPLGLGELRSQCLVGFLLYAQALKGNLFMSLLLYRLHTQLMLGQSVVFESLDYYAVFRGGLFEGRLLTKPERV
jgi:hypothetical protein